MRKSYSESDFSSLKKAVELAVEQRDAEVKADLFNFTANAEAARAELENLLNAMERFDISTDGDVPTDVLVSRFEHYQECCSDIYAEAEDSFNYFLSQVNSLALETKRSSAVKLMAQCDGAANTAQMLCNLAAVTYSCAAEKVAMLRGRPRLRVRVPEEDPLSLIGTPEPGAPVATNTPVTTNIAVAVWARLFGRPQLPQVPPSSVAGRDAARSCPTVPSLPRPG